ncbi:MAG: hypothetical protein ACK452_13740, partial [Bacteroidota bacterium]
MEGEIIINKGYLEELGLVDLIVMPIFFLFIVFYSNLIKNKNLKKSPYYVFFQRGIITKFFGSVAFCFAFTYYYKGGDTVAYYESCRAFSNLLFERPGDYIDVIFGDGSIKNYSLFSSKTGYPW